MSHNSDSSIQKEIELKVIDNLCYIFKIPRQKVGEGELKVDETKFQVDFYVESMNMYGEIYAGLVEMKSGQKRKILADMLKLITIEKILRRPIEMYIVFIDKKIHEKFSESSWGARVAKEFAIKLLVVELDDESIKKLKEAKKRQGQQFKTIK